MGTTVGTAEDKQSTIEPPIPTLSSLGEGAAIRPSASTLPSPGKGVVVGASVLTPLSPRKASVEVGNSREESWRSPKGEKGLPFLAFAPLLVTDGTPASSSRKPCEVVSSESRVGSHFLKDADEAILASPWLEGRTWQKEALEGESSSLRKLFFKVSSCSLLRSIHFSSSFPFSSSF